MEVKLIKTEVNYLLENEKGVVIASTSLKKEGLSLSLKNCQAIELGYDLDELAKEKYPYEKTEMFSCFELDCKQEGFIEGAKTILEILGDKKYRTFTTNYARDRFYNVLLPSLQQTEWDVEIVMEDVFVHSPSLSPNQKSQWEKKPKLDADGCLILKRI